MFDQFARQNRWWLAPGAIAGDRNLARLRAGVIQWVPALPFRFDRDAIYTLRGPRQVGKTTVLKRQIEQLLATGWPAQHILYLDVELAGLERGPDLIAALRGYVDGERSPLDLSPARLVIFLDEVTRVDNWAGALRGLVDNNELQGVTLVVTGSHTRDLHRGGERLPGRRGGGSELDLELQPLSFREYVALVDPGLPLLPTVGAIAVAEVAAGQRERAGLRPRLIALFRRYLATGGFLAAMNDAARDGAVAAETFQVYRDAIIGEFTRAGLRESYLREVVNWVARHLGQEFDSRGIAADTDIGSKDTAQNYVDQLVATYVAGVFYRTSSLEHLSPAFRAPKKLYPLDPLFWHLLRAWAASDPDPWQAAADALGDASVVGHLVESVVMVHLRRAFGEQVFYWRPDQRREIDAVVRSPDNTSNLAEIKYQSRIDSADVRHLVSAGGGIVVSRDLVGDVVPGSVYALPAAELLALLPTSSLAPVRV